jgi:hypothetical protein
MKSKFVILFTGKLTWSLPLDPIFKASEHIPFVVNTNQIILYREMIFRNDLCLFQNPFLLLWRISLWWARAFISYSSRSRSDTPHSVGLLWTSDQPDAETATWQHAAFTRDRHMPPAVRGAIDPRLTPRGHRDRLLRSIQERNTLFGQTVESLC